MKIRNKKGFTLVELLVVISIIGILAVVAVPSLMKNINKAKISKLKADMCTLEIAVKSFYLDNDRLPCTQKENDSTDLDDLFEYMDSEYPYMSPFGEEYLINCIHNGEECTDGEVQRIDVGGFNLSNEIAEMIENDEFFIRLKTTLPESNDKERTIWMVIDI